DQLVHLVPPLHIFVSTQAYENSNNTYVLLASSSNPAAADAAPTPTGEHEGLNSPLPPVPNAKEKETAPLSPIFSSNTEPLVGSSVSPDEDVQAALEKAANPDEYKVEVIPPMQMEGKASTAAVPPNQLKEDESSIVESTRAVGGQTPMTPLSSENASYKFTEKPATAATSLGVGAGAFAADHALKDQKAAAERRQDLEPTTKDSFMHVVIPATPGAGMNEQEKFDTKKSRNGTLTTPTKKKERSGSVSAGEASPSSPSKGGVFSGIRKLTKKKHR
ncbi:6313_t:CDS:1, partial [Acaulospora colombiana]